MSGSNEVRQARFTTEQRTELYRLVVALDKAGVEHAMALAYDSPDRQEVSDKRAAAWKAFDDYVYGTEEG